MLRKLISIIALAAVLFCGLSCGQDDSVTEIELKSVSATSFDAAGGFGTAEVEAGGLELKAESSAPEWLRVSVAGSSVLFNVFSYTGDTERTADIAISAEGCSPVKFSVTQSAFNGIIISESSLQFSDSDQKLQTLVKCTSDFSVEIPENPDDIFSFEKSASGVTFIVNKAQSRREFSGRAVITPSDKSISPVYVTLTLPKKPDWYYLLGTWKVARNTEDGGDKSDFVFTTEKAFESFSVAVQKDELKNYPFSAQLVDGKVRIGIQGFGIDEAANKYYSVHFNGPTSSNPLAFYIFSTEGRAAWDAEPVFDDVNHTVTLSFENAKLNNNDIPQQMNIWWSRGKFFAFTTPIVKYQQLVLTKEYTE